MLRAILWGITGDILKATRWATRSGQLIGWAMVAYAVLGVLGIVPGASDTIWLGLIGWFIAWLAGSAYRQQEVRSRLAAITVGSIMTPHPQTVPGEMTVEQLAHDHFLGGQHSRYPVLFEGSVHGLVSLADIKAVDRPDWPFVRVIDVTNRDLQALTVSGRRAGRRRCFDALLGREARGTAGGRRGPAGRESSRVPMSSPPFSTPRLPFTELRALILLRSL